MPLQLSRRRRPRLLLPAALAASLALTACGSGSGPSMEELETRIAPSTDASAPVADPSALAELRFDAEALACSPRITTNAPGAWETSAPRTAVTEGAPLKLRDSEADEGAEADVKATVTAPGGKTHQAEAAASGTDWVELNFPADFGKASAPAGGAYTVVWTTSEGGYIACDGFRAD